jgi:hypothetical protein
VAFRSESWCFFGLVLYPPLEIYHEQTDMIVGIPFDEVGEGETPFLLCQELKVLDATALTADQRPSSLPTDRKKPKRHVLFHERYSTLSASYNVPPDYFDHKKQVVMVCNALHEEGKLGDLKFESWILWTIMWRLETNINCIPISVSVIAKEDGKKNSPHAAEKMPATLSKASLPGRTETVENSGLSDNISKGRRGLCVLP